MWWTYFDISALQGEHALASEPEATRPRLARDAYSFLHFPLLVGIVLTAVGLKKVLEYVGDTAHHELSDPLTGAAPYVLYGGVAVYLLGHVAFKWRTVRALNPVRFGALGVVVALAPFAAQAPALLALALVTAVVLAVVVFENVYFAEHRNQIRHEIHGGS